jgi:hypothetical protein
VVSAILAHAVLAASAQRLQVDAKAFAHGALLSKCHVLPLQVPTVLKNMKLCVAEQHRFSFGFNAFSPSPRHLLGP